MEQAVKDYDEERVREIRKLAAAYAVNEGAPPEEAATEADGKAFEIEQQRAVQEGEYDEAEAIERLIDRKTAQFCTWFENNAPVLVEKGCEYVGGIIGAFLGDPQRGKEMGRTFGKHRAPLIHKGAKILTSYCKRYVEKAKSVLKMASKCVKNVCKAIFG